MSYKQNENEAEQEVTVIHMLSAVFITLMLLVINSYSDVIPPLPTDTRSVISSIDNSSNKSL